MIDRFQGKFRFLSNFHPAPVIHRAAKFPTVEHAYQAAKFDEYDIIKLIHRAPTPGEAKRLGRAYVDRARLGWTDEQRLETMEALLRQKFVEPTLRDRLLATGMAEIIEGNNWGDRFWGAVWNPAVHQYEGQNHLGRLLMKIRRDLAVQYHGAGQPGFGGPPFER